DAARAQRASRLYRIFPRPSNRTACACCRIPLYHYALVYGRNNSTSSVGIGGLYLRIEFHGVAALLPGAIGGFLAAAKRHMIVDPGGGNIDHHHSGLAVALEMAGVLEARGADAGGQAERR